MRRTSRIRLGDTNRAMCRDSSAVVDAICCRRGVPAVCKSVQVMLIREVNEHICRTRERVSKLSSIRSVRQSSNRMWRDAEGKKQLVQIVQGNLAGVCKEEPRRRVRAFVPQMCMRKCCPSGKLHTWVEIKHAVSRARWWQCRCENHVM